MMTSIERARSMLQRRMIDRRILGLSRQVQKAAPRPLPGRPVAFFNASTRLGGVSLNAAFASLAAMSLQLAGVPVRYFACRQGLMRCTLGVVMNGVDADPPCRTCIAQSDVLFDNAPATWLEAGTLPDLPGRKLAEGVERLSVGEMETFEYEGVPLGELVLPSVRWTQRVHHLSDDGETRRLFGAFIQSAHHVVRRFEAFLDEEIPRRVVVFNGISYPEAAARWISLQRGVPVVTHEVAHQPLTAFFSHGHVTAYPVEIPEAFVLSAAQEKRLDEYLSLRFQGEFSMAGLNFWPEMKGLDAALSERIQAYRQMVPVFSNVIFDTAQLHANVVFEHMFAWLDQVAGIVRAHPDTLFVLRAHPDELRPGSRKQARETVNDWYAGSGLDALANVVYIPPDEYLSSYALIQQAKFVMVYNSTIGLEAALMGVPVLNGGRARYTQVECVYLPESVEGHREMAQAFLAAAKVEMPAAFLRNARRFQYYQLWRTPLPFEDFLEPHKTRGYVSLKDFPVEALHPDNSETMRVIVEGILNNREFLMPEKMG